jgi:membrane protein DedA with SNARE-associated domain
MMDSAMAFLQSLQGLPAYALVFALLAVSGLGLPVNEDILLLAAAALALKGVMQPVVLVAVAWCGLMVADGLVYYWGRRFGGQLLQQRWLARVMPAARLAAMQDTMRRHGPASICVGRFLPGFRSPLFFAAGSLGLPYRRFLAFDGAAALVELPALVYAVRYVGGRWQSLTVHAQGLRDFVLPALLALLLLAGVAVWLRSRRRAP